MIQLHGKGEKDRWVMLPAPDAEFVGNIHPHRLRHTYVTVAVRNGVSIVQVSDDLGHARLDTTQTYLHTEGVEHSAARVVSGIYHAGKQ